MEVQPQLVLLQKTLLNIEGLGRQLDPQLDLWETAKPFLDRWMDEQIGIRGMLAGLKRSLPIMAEKLPEIPELVYSVIKKAEKEQAKVALHDEELKAIRQEIAQSNRRTVLAIIIAALMLLSGIVLFQ